MGYLAIDGLHYGVALVADEDFAGEIGVGERGEGGEDEFPAGFPLGGELCARCGGELKFGVAIAVGLFPVGGEEIGPAGTHVAIEMFDDDGDGIRFCVEGDAERLIGSLCDRAFAQAFVMVEQADGVGEIGARAFVGHGGILHRFRGRGNRGVERRGRRSFAAVIRRIAGW